MFERTYIRLDVHAQSIVACALNPYTGEFNRPRWTATLWRSGVDPRWAGARPSTRPGPPVSAWPGSCGHGIDCLIAAPSKLLRAPGNE